MLKSIRSMSPNGERVLGTVPAHEASDAALACMAQAWKSLEAEIAQIEISQGAVLTVWSESWTRKRLPASFSINKCCWSGVKVICLK